MHTVFINASKNHIHDRMDVLWMEREYQQYMTFNCPIDTPNGLEEGFKGCALQLGEKIDVSKDINNDFNLIVYADYLELEEHFRQLFPDYDAETWTENAVYHVAEDALAHLFATKLYDALEHESRLPKDKMLLLIEQKYRRDTKENDYFADRDSVQRTRKQNERIIVLSKLLGLPTEEKMQEMAEAAADRKVLAEQLRAVLKENRLVTAGIDWQCIYSEQLEMFFKEVAEGKGGIGNACEALETLITKAAKADYNTTILATPFITDRRSLSTNKAVDTARNLQLQMFIWDCIHTGTVYAAGPHDNTNPKKVPYLDTESWKQLVNIFNNKRLGLIEKREKVSVMAEEFRALGLVPPLYKLPHEKFGLDESGNRHTKYATKIVAGKMKEQKPKDDAAGNTEEAKNAKNDDDENNRPEPIVRITGDRVVLEEVEHRKTNWFEGQYVPLDVDGEDFTAEVEGLQDEETYLTLARNLAQHHKDFMSKLQQNVRAVMSYYAGRSKENKPALLRKRAVSANDARMDAGVNDYKYADGRTIPETDAADNVVARARQSYLTLLMEYLHFNAARGVAMTTIEEKCEQFMTRIKAISESLRVLYRIGWIIAAFLLVLYLPFPLIQWELITRNFESFGTFLVMFAVPFLLLTGGYFLTVQWQKRKMMKAWEELLQASHDIAAENREAVREYEALLTMHIPSLRWIYEYVLDVEFYCDCNSIAWAKIQHHMEKLDLAAEVLGNIMEDLEYRPDRYSEQIPELKIDFTQAFCEGNNRKVYAIIDDDVEELMRKGRLA